MKPYQPYSKKNIWYDFYSERDKNIKFLNDSIYERFKSTYLKYPERVALDYYGNKITFSGFYNLIKDAAKAFKSYGVRKKDVVTLLMPNIPEALIAFYALNKIGAIANMVHPLSGNEEIKDILIKNKSVMLVMYDACFSKVNEFLKDTDVFKVITVGAEESMPLFLRIAYNATEGRKIRKPLGRSLYISWKDFIKRAKSYEGKVKVKMRSKDVAVILHSGGTTGIPKGIMLTNGNFNDLASQVCLKLSDLTHQERADYTREPGKTLGILPVFHGFGLAVNIHSILSFGYSIILIPRFSAKDFGNLIMKHKPNIIVGVPTLFEAMIDNDMLKDKNLSFLEVAVVGGDSLSSALEKRINNFFSEHGVTNNIIRGYGLTEATAAVIASFGLGPGESNLIGIPLPGNYVTIVDPTTNLDLKRNEVGEICLVGPSVMKGYMNNKEETQNVLVKHKDGKVWLHTGDLGYMDDSGLIHYSQRLKRMIIVSGYNVYPSQVENVINSYPNVKTSCVIGIPDPYKVEIPKAFIVLEDKNKKEGNFNDNLRKYCLKKLARYAVPHHYEIRDSLPVTPIGKIDFKKLEREEKEDD